MAGALLRALGSQSAVGYIREEAKDDSQWTLFRRCGRVLQIVIAYWTGSPSSDPISICLWLMSTGRPRRIGWTKSSGRDGTCPWRLSIFNCPSQSDGGRTELAAKIRERLLLSRY